ncbi:hypothetical protein DL96DRAFT_1822826 [Flagelloscypha sp. PMI_526]|nr:hypothetical protein DL96DRAFT_1822826 [Flagelloscypha sp. PMI_526]
MAITSVSSALDTSIGSMYICSVLASMLFGISCLQSFTYFSNYRRDWAVLRISVAALLLLEAVHLGLSITMTYSSILQFSADPLILLVADWEYKMLLTLTVAIVLTVESLYGIRIYRRTDAFRTFLEKRSLTTPIAIVIFSGYGLGAYLTVLLVYIYRIHYLTDVSGMKWVVWTCLGSICLKDFLICGALCYYLGKARTGFLKVLHEPVRKNHTIVRLMMYIIATGMLTSAGTLGAILCFTLLPNSSIFLGTILILTHLYLNSFLSMLNSRKAIRQGRQRSVSASSTTPSSPFAGDRVRFHTTQTITRDPISPSNFTPIPQDQVQLPALPPLGGLSQKRSTARTSFLNFSSMSHIFGGATSPTTSEFSRKIALGVDDTASTRTKIKIEYSYGPEWRWNTF